MASESSVPLGASLALHPGVPATFPSTEFQVCALDSVAALMHHGSRCCDFLCQGGVGKLINAWGLALYAVLCDRATIGTIALAIKIVADTDESKEIPQITVFDLKESSNSNSPVHPAISGVAQTLCHSLLSSDTCAKLVAFRRMQLQEA